jgi:NADPH:quinone reductase-like Zn-dependent oxidoreductase
MQAAQFHEYGGPEVITTSAVPKPHPTADQLLIRVGATTVNGGELFFRSGKLRLISGSRFPKALGIDFAGEVMGVGSRTTDFEIGDRLWGVLDSRRMTLTGATTGAAADYLVVDAKRVAPLPAGLNFVDAVALMAGTTAMTALRDKARVRTGERVLIRGGTGGVGYVGVQLAREMGAHVTALVSEPNLETARSLGAHIALDYRATDPADLGPYDVIFDTVGTRMHDYHRRLAPAGRMVSITVVPPLRGLATILASSIHGRRRIRAFSGNPTRRLLDDYATYLESGRIRPLIAARYPLTELADAHRAIERGGTHGKHVIDLGL